MLFTARRVYFMPPKVNCAIYSAQLVCMCVNHLKRCKTSNLGFLFNAFYKFARGLEPICLSRRSYGISVDEWSDQPLVAALFFPFFVARG